MICAFGARPNPQGSLSQLGGKYKAFTLPASSVRTRAQFSRTCCLSRCQVILPRPTAEAPNHGADHSDHQIHQEHHRTDHHYPSPVTMTAAPATLTPRHQRPSREKHTAAFSLATVTLLEIRGVMVIMMLDNR